MWAFCTWLLLTVLLMTAAFVYGLCFKSTTWGRKLFGLAIPAQPPVTAAPPTTQAPPTTPDPVAAPASAVGHAPPQAAAGNGETAVTGVGEQVRVR